MLEYLDLTLPTPAENLALDEALLEEAEVGTAGEVLRFWELSSLAVVLGSASRLHEDVDEAACLAHAVPILRRCSGGGTVLQGPGCLNYSLVLAMDSDAALSDVTRSFAYILHRVAEALDGPALHLDQPGGNDLAIQNRKVSGNAQRRRRRFLLHHGTLLYASDLAKLGRFLRLPTRQPEYRGDRSHDDFVTNLPLLAHDIKNRLRKAWSADQPRTRWPAERVQLLVREKYSNPAWTRRR